MKNYSAVFKNNFEIRRNLRKNREEYRKILKNGKKIR